MLTKIDNDLYIDFDKIIQVLTDEIVEDFEKPKVITIVVYDTNQLFNSSFDQEKGEKIKAKLDEYLKSKSECLAK